MREAYRLAKQQLYTQWPEDACLSLAFLYTARQTEDYAVIDAAVQKLIGVLLKKTGHAASNGQGLR